MKRKTVALYDPFLDVMGGGERHILSIMKVLEDEGFDPTIFWDTNITAEIQNKLHLSFKSPITFKKNIFSMQSESVFSRLHEMTDFDIFIYVTDGSYFFTSAKKNFIFCMVPQRSLYNMTPLNKLKTINSTFISNSYFTKNIIQQWSVSSQVLYPYIQDEFLQNFSLKKEKSILVVGRFFKHLHAKRQDIAIKWFTQFQEDNKKLANYKLILAGSLKDEDKPYFDELQELAKGNNSIEFQPNVSFDELLKLYNKAEIYWHFTGIEVDPIQNPEKVEHLGITPLEAMASGCLVFGFNAGGLKELIQDGKNGYLFSTRDQLFSKMGYALFDEINREIICKQAHQFVKDTFSYSQFAKRVKEVMI